MVKSIYIHIPFCDNICSYCDFCKIYYNKNYADKYLETLKKELELKYNDEIMDTIYIGGGTPSSLDYNQLEKLFKILSKIKKSKNYEYTIECNPESMNLEKIKLFKKYGINRVSIGVQTFDENILKTLNRKHNKKQVINLINNLNEEGIHNINIDMMFAIPKQTCDNLDNDLKIISKLNIKHISYYSLILEEHTKLFIDKFKVFDEDLEFLMYNKICDYLKNIGYNHYEISNFSKEKYQSIHNLNYWKNNNYIAIGLGAVSYINNTVYENTKSITEYIKEKYMKCSNNLSDYDIYINELMLGLRLADGINKIDFKHKFGKDIEEIFNLKNEIDKKRLIDDGFNIFINPKYIYVSNDIITNIMMEGVVCE